MNKIDDYNTNTEIFRYADPETSMGKNFYRYIERDNEGRVIYVRYNNGTERHTTYHGKNETSTLTIGKFKITFEYENGRLTHSKDSNSYERWHEYNKDGKEIHCKDSTRKEWFAQYE